MGVGGAGTTTGLSTSAGSPWGTLEEASRPAIQVDPAAGNLFVAWHGDIADGQLHNDPEVYGCAFDNLGNPLDIWASPLSDMDSLQTPVPGAGPPSVAINVHHGYKMLGVGALVAQEILGEESRLLQPFRFERYARGELHPTSNSPFPWS